LLSSNDDDATGGSKAVESGRVMSGRADPNRFRRAAAAFLATEI